MENKGARGEELRAVPFAIRDRRFLWIKFDGDGGSEARVARISRPGDFTTSAILNIQETL
jgi:hypothetical protein